MARTIPAIVTPEVLRWARNLDSITLDEVAAKLHLTPEKIQEWENGKSYPTMKQAKDLAKYYRVPFVYFYLPNTPQKTKRIEKTDFRTFGNIGDRFFMSRELRWLLRDIEDRRDTMLSLYAEDKKAPERLPINIEPSVKEDSVARNLRVLLELDDKQKTFRKPEVALSHCIRVLEKYDILVFQAAKIDPMEMRGLSVAYDIMPIIVLNRKDEPSARLFTLCHELVHVLTRTSGICNEISEKNLSQNQLELTCNRIAGNALVPIELLKQNKAIDTIKHYGFDDTYVNALARDFAVSKNVILHRLWEIKLISKQFYFDTLKRYDEEYLAHSAKKTGGFLPPATDTGTQVGKLYARTVLNAYHAERISARDTSNYLLNLKIQNFRKLERWCF